MKKLTLIGGAPLSGKTTLSRKVAAEDNAVEISTDSIRTMMQSLVSRDEYPDLFYASDMSAEEFYEIHKTPDSVVQGEINESFQVQKGISALLNTAITWDHLVIEGIAITPEFIEEIRQNFIDREIEAYILVEKNKERVLERVQARGLWGPLDTYPASLHETEVEWVMLYNQWFEDQANKFDVEIVEI